LPEPGLSLLAAVAVSFAVAAVLTPVAARLAVVLGWIDHPDGGRKLHRAPVPAVGGVAVFAGFAGAAAALHLSGIRLVEEGPFFGESWPPLLASGFAISLIGLIDDVRRVRPLAKLAVQVAAAFFLYVAGFQVTGVSNPFGGSIDLGAFALPVTVLWLVGMSNAFNLIDGLDGLAAGLALVSTLGLLAVAAASGR
jgi:UDP-GlcNAc:undecaprenyl-phosphate GlcNAc-1-phosphate transferase